MVQQSPRRVATILWASLLAGPTMFLGIALYIVFGLRGGAGTAEVPLPEPAMIGASLTFSLVTMALTRLRVVRMASARGDPRSGIPPGPEADAIARLVLACALCEAGALAAVVVFLLTGNALALAPYALSWLALAARFPGDRQWVQLTGVRAVAGRRPMIRG